LAGFDSERDGYGPKLRLGVALDHIPGFSVNHIDALNRNTNVTSKSEIGVRGEVGLAVPFPF
jgi:hypothetical protein